MPKEALPSPKQGAPAPMVWPQLFDASGDGFFAEKSVATVTLCGEHEKMQLKSIVTGFLRFHPSYHIERYKRNPDLGISKQTFILIDLQRRASPSYLQAVIFTSHRINSFR